MKVARITFLALLVALLAVGVSTTSYAFHSGGVAECGGCHSMHAPKAGGSFLLVGSDQSSTCLSCHQHAGDTAPSSYHVSTADADMPAGSAPLQRTPGGDFGWLKKGYTFTVRGTVNNELAETHGHNVVAADYAYIADPTNTIAPGGTFPASQFGCQSCHDPHSGNRRLSDGTYAKGATLGTSSAPIIASGSYNTSVTPAAGQAVGVYRLLRGLGDASQGVTFAGVGIAIAPSTYNQKEDANQVRVAYGAAGTNTWGNWCGTCHADMHSSGNYVHPVDESLGSDIANNYNAYVKSGDLTGLSTASFSSLVPFMENTGDIATLQSHAKNDGTYLNGPGSSDKVACLSCHRAHASGFPEMLRWNMENEFIVKNNVYQVTERGRTTAEAAASYYDRPVTTFASYQRVLCNKCHAKD
ncbi:MAG: cytochrome C [Desulfobacteria bacterium]